MKLTHKEEYLPKAANILAYILPGEKERICFYCPEKKCKGECKRYREEMKKLKERKKK